MAMAAINRVAQDELGNAITGVTVEVRAEIAGSPLVQLYSDRAGSTTLGNPYTSATAQIQFFVPPGTYQITLTKDGESQIERYAVAIEKPSDSFGVTPQQLGAVADGVTDDAAAFTALSLVDENQIIPAGSYAIGSDVTWAAGDAHILVDPNAEFSGAGRLRFDNLLPYHSDLFSFDIQYKVLDGSFPAYSDVFVFGRYVRTDTARKGVALYGEGEANFSGANAWGINTAGIAAVTGATAIGAEITALSNASGTTTTGILIGGKGTNANTTALQISSSSNSNAFGSGININNTSTKSSILSTGTLFQADQTVCAEGIALEECVFSSFEYASPNLFLGANTADFNCRAQLYGTNAGKVGLVARGYAGTAGAATVMSVNISAVGADIDFFTNGKEVSRAVKIDHVAGTLVNYLQLRGAATAGQPIVMAEGSDTDIYLAVRGKGSQGVLVQDGAGATKVRVNTTGIGFNGSSAIAKPSITGSRGGNAALASLLTNLATYGLITDSSTA